MELRRVVVTGLGTVNPIGNNVVDTWEAMMQGRSGIAPITAFDSSLFKTHFAGEVKGFDMTVMMDRREVRKLDRYAQFAVFTAREALSDSGLDLENENRDRMGVVWGSGMGGLLSFEEDSMGFARGNGVPHFNPFYIPKSIANMGAGHISIMFGLKGPSFATTSACSSSGHAIASAYDAIRLGRADVMLTGGSDADVTYSGVGGFNALRALSTRNDDPATASRPFSKSRDGFVLGEGGGCIVLESLEHARARGARIYAEMIGVGLNSDAYHMTAPDPDGTGAAKVMTLALQDAGIAPEQVDYINTHGTSTQLGDISEVKAILNVFGEHTYRMNLSSTKSMMGHLMGGTGAVEAVATILSVYHSIVPPTINHEDGDEDENIDYRINFTFNRPQERTVDYAISNTFGFGGHNACLVFKKF